MEVSLFTLKLALLLFWAAWFAMVFLTNLLSGLKAAGMLGKEWKFASTNYEAVAKAVAIYDAPPWVPRLLFSGVVVWQFIAATLFGWAMVSSCRADALNLPLVNAAFFAGLALWGAFMLADEITINYQFERTHELLFIAQLATLVALYLL
jgi:hypothetical protein